MTGRQRSCAGDGQVRRQAGTAYLEEAGFLASVDEIMRYGAGDKQPIELSDASIFPALQQSGQYPYIHRLSLVAIFSQVLQAHSCISPQKFPFFVNNSGHL